MRADESRAAIGDLLLRRARAEAEAIVATASDDAQRLRAQAERDAAAMIARARDEGRAAGSRVARQQRRAAERDADAAALAAARRAELRLEAACRDAALALRSDARYPAILGALSELARERLGDDAVLTVDPPDGGGVIAATGTRRLDLTLPSLAAQALEQQLDQPSPGMARRVAS